MSVEFRYGSIASNYPNHDNHNTMIGISGDIGDGEYEEFYYHSSNGELFGSARNVGSSVFKYMQASDDFDRNSVCPIKN